MRKLSWRDPVPLMLFVVCAGYAAVLLLAPIAAITQGAFSVGIAKLIDALTQSDALHAFQMTFFLAGGAVLVNTVAGVILAWVLVRHRFPGKRVLNALVDTPFVFSPVIAGYVLVLLFGRNGWFAQTPFPIVFAWPGMLLATIFVSLPFVTREVQGVLTQLDQDQEYAAYTMGASRWKTFRKIILPELWNGLLYGIVLTFARSIGEFGAVAVAGGSIQGLTETATIYVFRSLNNRNTVGAYGISFVLGMLVIILLLAMSRLRTRSSRRKGLSDIVVNQQVTNQRSILTHD